MPVWPLEGGITGIVSVDRNLRGILRRGGELAASALLKKEALERYLRLAVVGGAAIAIGTSVAEWPGAATTTTTKKVVHGLGITPKAVFVIRMTEGPLGSSAFAYTATEFSFQVSTVDASKPGAGTKAEVAWIAIG